MHVKNRIKHFLARYGLWYRFDLIRRSPEIFRWLGAGCAGVAPHPVKLMVLRSYLRKFSLEQFVETGTYLGDTLDYIAGLGIECTSIELSRALYEAACARFRGRSNVRLVQGDSGQALPEMLALIKKPTLFWLDGHYSAGVTARAAVHTPISFELRVILNHPIKRHVILIDDAHCFDGSDNYPCIEDLLRVVHDQGHYSAEVSTDIVRLVPREEA